MSEGTNVSNNRIKAIETKKNELFSNSAQHFYYLNDIVSLYSDDNDTLDFVTTVKHCLQD